MSVRRGILALLAVAAIGLSTSDAEAQCATQCNAIAPGCNVVNCLGGVCFGTAGSDCIIGTPGPDTIFALGGNDCICGEAGDDIINADTGSDFIFGGDGSDNISGGDDNDFIFGEGDDDTLNGDGGDDQIFGAAGDDTLNGGAGDDTLFGEAGADTLRGDDGNDTLNGGTENDQIFGGIGADTLNGDAGSDTLRGEGGDDQINGGSGNDQLFGGDGADSLSGGTGDDSLSGGAGDDPQLDGGDGEDTINGGAGNDTANGGPGTDFINGGPDNDTLDGGDDPDIINGDGGDDVLSGDGGNDTLDGGAGTDNLFGNAGIDTCLNSVNMDPSCENFTHATVDAFAAFTEGGSVFVRWTTGSEAGTVGFRLYRESEGEWISVHDGTLIGLLSAPQGGVYELRDDGAEAGETQRYLLVEIDVQGHEAKHGPFEVTPDVGESSMLEGDAVYARTPHPLSPNAFAAKASSGEKQGEGEPVAIYLGVEETGLYVVTASEIAARFGLDEESVRSLIRGGEVRLTEQGKPVRWRGAGDGSELRFFGLQRKSLYTVERIYRLSLEPGSTMEERSAAPDALTAGLTYSGHVHLEQDVVEGVLVADDPEADYWFWQAISATATSPMTAEVTFDLEAVAGGGSLRLSFHGISLEPHIVDVELNGISLGSVVFEGRVPHEATLSVPEAALQDGENTLTMQPVGTSDSQVYFNFADLDYTRRYETAGSSLRFEGVGDASLEVVGLVGSELDILDVTDPRSPVRLVDTVPSPTGVQLATEIGRDYFASSDLRSPRSIWNDLPSDLRSGDNAAEYLVVAPAELLDGARELASYREADGFIARVVDLQDVYDEFAFGTPDPNALRAFLAHAHANWASSPEYVVLVGKGSFDYRDLKGLGGNLLSPIMASTSSGLYSSDTKFADFLDDDGLPDVSIGRLPVSSTAELDAIIAQIVAYEDGLDSVRNDVAMLADATTDQGSFSGWADEATAELPVDWSVTSIYRSELGDRESTRALLFDELQAGPRVFGYLGHAGLTALGRTEVLLEVDDLETVTVDGPQPIFAGMTCVASRFATPGLVTLGEAMLISDDAAIAVWGPSGVSINEQASLLLEGLLAELSAETGTRLGPMIDRAFGALEGSEHQRDMVEIYHLFGDPALRVAKGGDVPGTGGTSGTGGTPGTGGTTPPDPSLGLAGCSAGTSGRTGFGGALFVLLGLAVARRMRRSAPLS